MDPDRRKRILKTSQFVAGGLVISAVANRGFAYLAGGDTTMFDQLLIGTCIVIPICGLIRALRIYIKG